MELTNSVDIAGMKKNLSRREVVIWPHMSRAI